MHNPPHAKALSPQDRIDWLRLARSENVGPLTFRTLLQEYGSAGAALDALPGLAGRGGRRNYKPCPLHAAEGELAAADKAGALLHCLPDEGFPELLRHTDPPPPLIYSKGATALLHKPGVAIVGSRNASALGQTFAKSLAFDIGAAGFMIVSGLARGIDTAAHWGSLGSGTAAVLAGGIDVIYPPENAKLYEAICAEGVLLSENPPGVQPRAQDFPRRNRLISGLALGVVIVEAARQSGSLVTARFALEQNREVFAVPGHPLDPRAEGTNGLIRNGANIVTSADDVISALSALTRDGLNRGFAEPEHEQQGGPDKHPEGQRASISEADRHTLLCALSVTPVLIDQLAAATGLGPQALNVMMLELELSGKLQRHPHGFVSLALKHEA